MTLHVLVASGGYKKSLSAEKVVAAIARGVRGATGRIDVTELPLVDGGEGTARTLCDVLGGRLIEHTVTGPTGEPVTACYGRLDDGRAVIELAEAAGLQHVEEAGADLLDHTSRGVGELIRAALDAGIRHIVVGCGDSGINDGGAGLCRALGVRLLDADGCELPDGGRALTDLARIDVSARDPRLAETTIDVACNTDNQLTGEHGVARTYGPQKGASEAEIEKLSAAMTRWAAVLSHDLGVDVAALPGAGASGGCGAGLAGVLGARLVSRFDYLFPMFGVTQAIEAADLVITAEGGLDAQSVNGKIPAEIGRLGAAHDTPVIVLAGIVDPTAKVILDHGVQAYFSISERPQPLSDAIESTSTSLEHAAEHLLRTFLAGVAVGRLQVGEDRLPAAEALDALSS